MVGPVIRNKALVGFHLIAEANRMFYQNRSRVQILTIKSDNKIELLTVVRGAYGLA